jgi:hypothetical protein
MPTARPTVPHRQAAPSIARAPRTVRSRVAGAATCALASTALLIAGCGAPSNHDAPAGTTVVQDGVAYSVQISSALNPLEPDNRALLRGLARRKNRDGPATTLVGVFLQARDESSGPRRTVDAPQLVSAFGQVFQPLHLPATDPFAYHGRRLRPGEQIPGPMSVAAEGPEDGAALVYRLPSEVFLTDRPFTLRFGSDQRAASVELDL